MKNSSDHFDTGFSDYFQDLYLQDGDPWLVRQRWYEQRKRALVLASLPQQRYHNAYEAGCGNGELTAALAQRCDKLLAGDMSEQAIRLTAERLAEAGAHDHVRLALQQLPRDFPRKAEQQYDLILISEVAYYLDQPALALLAECSAASLAPGGTLLACHWRAPFKQRVQSTARVHGVFHAQPGLHRMLRHEEDDFLLEVWSNTTLSVAQREGFV